MHDGKNFRQLGSAAVFAPGHKTAMGQKGAATDEDLKEKKRAKNERKQVYVGSHGDCVHICE